MFAEEIKGLETLKHLKEFLFNETQIEETKKVGN